jgi:ABC-type amino acid transport substrate-binding protein
MVAAISMAALLLSFELLPSAKADEQICLKIALPEMADHVRTAERYKQSMAEAGLCVQPVWLPNKRTAVSLRRGEIDGVFTSGDGIREVAGIPLVHGNVVTGRPKSVLVTADRRVKALSDLKNQEIGVWLGDEQRKKELVGVADVISVPGGADMMIRMLRHGRLDGLLIDDYSLRNAAVLPDGYRVIELDSQTAYSWLRKEFEGLLPQFNVGTDIFRAALDTTAEVKS